MNNAESGFGNILFQLGCRFPRAEIGSKEISAGAQDAVCRAEEVRLARVAVGGLDVEGGVEGFGGEVEGLGVAGAEVYAQPGVVAAQGVEDVAGLGGHERKT